MKKNLKFISILCIVCVSVMGHITLVQAAIYYISPTGNDSNPGTAGQPWATFAKAFKPGMGGMQGGDTLIIKDGTYTQAIGYYNENEKWNMYSPPSGSASTYTIIKSENDGKAIIQDAYIYIGGPMTYVPCTGCYSIAVGSSYIQIEGLKLLHSNINIQHSDHIKILRSGLKNPRPINSRYGSGIGIACDSHHILLEDVWVIGTFRYGISVFESYNNILRRVITRFDGNSEREPKAGIDFYGETASGTGCYGPFITGAHDNMCQNCVMLDYNPGISSGSGLEGGVNTPHGAKNIKFYGSIALNIPANGFSLHEGGSEGGYGNDIINSVAWGLGGCGIDYRDGDVGQTMLFNQVTAGNTANRAVCEWGSTLDDLTLTVKNSLFYNNSGPNSGVDISDYNWYYPASQAQGTNYLTTNPNIQYITRTPDTGTGEGGAKRGATIEKRYGVSGTLWGEPGYDQLTEEPLWPWPYEDKIHDDAAEPDGFAYPTTDWAGGAYTVVNNPARGFAAPGQTLTRYIWEYLGNPCPTDICSAASTASTYYISPAGNDANNGLSETAPFKTFSKAFSTMAAGDELILLDGTYGEVEGTGYISYLGTNSAQIPSGQSLTQPTYVHAKNSGNVKINGKLFIGRSFRKDQFIKIDGITFEGGGALYNTAFITIKNCEFHDTSKSSGAVFGIGTNDGTWGNSFNLIEDTWIWGQDRIIAINYRSSNNVWRRILIRGDGCNSASCTGSGNPNVGITVYDSSNVSLQNVIVVDRILNGGSPYGDFATAQHTSSGYWLGPAEWLGTISLGAPDTGYYFESDYANNYTIKMENCVVWNSTSTGFNVANSNFKNVSLIGMTSGETGYDAFRLYGTPSGLNLKRLIVYKAGRYGVNSNYIRPSYSDVFGSTSSAYNGLSCSVGCLTSNPLNDLGPSLKYITRIESGSTLSGTADNGADYGANIVNRYGADSSRYGEPGFNALTSNALWPWPNEAIIKKEMCIDQGETRGFCSAQSLTKYIWEYLGNPCPEEICGSSASSEEPLVLYTDLLSGPNSGGENNKGAYLSIFGRNFGTDLGTTTKVYINNVEVDNYRYLGPSKGRPDIQQITVQVGALGNPTFGIALPIKVVINGISSNVDHTFTVQPGDIIFVDNVNGDDSTAVKNDITKPWKHVQLPSAGPTAAMSAVGPGDVVVLRGKGVEWTDLGFENYFLKFRYLSGSQPTGAINTGPITITAYPNEDVIINPPIPASKGAITSVNGDSYPTEGKWVTVSNLRIIGNGDGGGVNLQNKGDYWRVVNNEISAPLAADTARAGGVTGNGQNAKIIGNRIHDIEGDGQHNHGIYLDRGHGEELAYNYIQNISGGNGIQTYNVWTSDGLANISIHHNLIDTTQKHGINIADGTSSGLKIYNNIITNTNIAGVRFNTNTLTNAKIYHNTFYNVGTSGLYSAIMNDWNFPANALDFQNNIVWTKSGISYLGGSVGFVTGTSFNKNIWYNGAGTPSNWDSNAIISNPLLVNPTGLDYSLQQTSPAIDAGSTVASGMIEDDYKNIIRPQGSGWDIGAYEYAFGGSAPACIHKSELQPCNGCVDVTELTTFIDRWKVSNQDVTLKELIEAIGLWKHGC